MLPSARVVWLLAALTLVKAFSVSNSPHHSAHICRAPVPVLAAKSKKKPSKGKKASAGFGAKKSGGGFGAAVQKEEVVSGIICEVAAMLCGADEGLRAGPAGAGRAAADAPGVPVLGGQADEEGRSRSPRNATVVLLLTLHPPSQDRRSQQMAAMVVTGDEEEEEFSNPLTAEATSVAMSSYDDAPASTFGGARGLGLARPAGKHVGL